MRSHCRVSFCAGGPRLSESFPDVSCSCTLSGVVLENDERKNSIYDDRNLIAIIIYNDNKNNNNNDNKNIEY